MLESLSAICTTKDQVDNPGCTIHSASQPQRRRPRASLSTLLADTAASPIFEQVRRAILERAARAPPNACLLTSSWPSRSPSRAHRSARPSISSFAEGDVVAQAASVIAGRDRPAGNDMLPAPHGPPSRCRRSGATPFHARRGPSCSISRISAGSGSEPRRIAFPIGQPEREPFPSPVGPGLLSVALWRRPRGRVRRPLLPVAMPDSAAMPPISVRRAASPATPSRSVITSVVRQSLSLLSLLCSDPGKAAGIGTGSHRTPLGLAPPARRSVPVPSTTRASGRARRRLLRRGPRIWPSSRPAQTTPSRVRCQPGQKAPAVAAAWAAPSILDPMTTMKGVPLRPAGPLAPLAASIASAAWPILQRSSQLLFRASG